MEFSVIVPMFNESSSFIELTDRLSKVLKSLSKNENFEIIFIDDGSNDSTRDIMQRLSNERKYVKGIFLRRNCGKSFALTAGFMYAKGDYIVTMDGDLQDMPEEIPKMIKKINEGYDLVSGWRQNRHDSMIKVLGSRLFNKVVSSLSGVRLHDFNCGFKIYRAKVVKSIFVYGQYHRFIPLLAYFMGFKVSEVLIMHDNRKYGTSKYPIFRYQGFFDLLSILFTYKYKFSPLYFFGLISCIFIIPSLIVLLYLVGMHFYALFGLGKGHLLFNRPLLTLSMTTFILGVNIFMTGFVCDFIIYHHGSKNIMAYIESLIDKAI